MPWAAVCFFVLYQHNANGWNSRKDYSQGGLISLEYCTASYAVNILSTKKWTSFRARFFHFEGHPYSHLNKPQKMNENSYEYKVEPLK